MDGQQGPVPPPTHFFIKKKLKVMSDNDLDRHMDGGRIPAYFAYFQRFYVYFTNIWRYEMQKSRYNHSYN